MGGLYSAGICCFCLSVWAVIQLTCMGFFYSMEASTLVEDVQEEDSPDIPDFLSKTKSNFQTVSTTCYYSAYLYLAMIAISWGMIIRGKYEDKMFAEQMLGEEGLCGTLAKPK